MKNQKCKFDGENRFFDHCTISDRPLGTYAIHTIYVDRHISNGAVATRVKHIVRMSFYDRI